MRSEFFSFLSGLRCGVTEFWFFFLDRKRCLRMI
jgi:hypothetical protein